MPLELEKKVTWGILAQCDARIVKEFVEIAGRPAQVASRLQSERKFRQRIKDETLWKNCYEVLMDAYKKLGSQFKIDHDNYGGYRLVYRGTLTLKSKIVLTDGPKGFLRPIENDASDLSIIRKSSDSSQLFLMLGPVRFINSDCEPNCEYDFSSLDTSLVRIRTLKPIRTNEEIFVKYGPEFFDVSECKCSTCAMKLTVDAPFEASLNNLSPLAPEYHVDFQTQQVEISEFSQRIIEPEIELRAELSASKLTVAKKRRRLTNIQKFKQYNELIGSFDINCELSSNSFTSVPAHEDPIDVRLISRDCGNNPEENQNQKELLESEFLISDELSFLHDVRRQITSSPLPQAEILCLPSNDSDFSTNCYIVPDEKTLYPMSIPLYTNSTCSKNNVAILIRSYASFHKLSDTAVNDLCHLMNSVLPQPNTLNSAYSLISNAKKRLEDLTSNSGLDKSCDNFCILKFGFLLKEIVSRNIKSILKYESRNVNDYSDYPVSKLTKSSRSDEFNLDLVLSTDGATFVNSSPDHQMYPIWLGILQLPPKLRMAKKNIALAGLFLGKGKPMWHKILAKLKEECDREVVVSLPNETEKFLKLRVVLIVADLMAKPDILNMYHHNGFYGCTYCTHPGFTIGRSHCYYPTKIKAKGVVRNLEFRIRETELNEIYVQEAEHQVRIGNLEVNVVGCKGRSAFSVLIEGNYSFCRLSFFLTSICHHYIDCQYLSVHFDLLSSNQIILLVVH